jgi:hypothetical protein
VIPESVADARFGVAGWAHPELAEALSAMDQDTQLLALIDEAADEIFNSIGCWQGSASELFRILANDHRTLSAFRRLVPYLGRLGTLLQRLGKSQPDRVVSYRRTKKERTYSLRQLRADGTIAELPQWEDDATD